IEFQRDQPCQPFCASDAVCTTIGVEFKGLSARINIHKERTWVHPVEAHASTVRCDRKLLITAAAVDHCCVVAFTTIVDVTAITRVPDHGVITVTTVDGVRTA